MPEQTGFFDRHHHLLRRLHSLSGVVPIGLFLIIHLTTNASVTWGSFNARSELAGSFAGRGVETFQHEVNFINNLPMVLLMEIFVLWIPIAFHAILGIAYILTKRRMHGDYKYGGHLRYKLQRMSGYVGFLFIFYHIATLRWGWDFMMPGGTHWNHHFAASTLAEAMRGHGGHWTIAGVIVSLGYFVGVSALVFHFANGLWSTAITWGLTVSEAAQKRWGIICAILGLGLMGAAWAAIFGFLTLDVEKAREVEARMVEHEHGTDKAIELLEEVGGGAGSLDHSKADD